jgi:hypothetical protein
MRASSATRKVVTLTKEMKIGLCEQVRVNFKPPPSIALKGRNEAGLAAIFEFHRQFSYSIVLTHFQGVYVFIYEKSLRFYSHM